MPAHILHIFAHQNADNQSMRDAIGSRQITSDQAEDCFAGLAAIVHRGADGYQAVLLDLSVLTSSDGEFFRLCARRFRHLPVMVYGTAYGDLNAAWAIAAGARGTIDVHDLDDLCEGPPAVPAKQKRSSPKSKLTDLVFAQIMRPGQRHTAHSALAERRQQQAEAQATDRADKRRRRRPGGKRRTPPETVEETNRPLLTREEVEALLGDDVAEEGRTGSAHTEGH